VAAGLLVAVALIAAVRQLPRSLHSAQAQIDTNANLSPLQRELAPAYAYGVHADLAVRAAEILPRNAVFYVATGGQPGSDAAPPFYAYWLLPRRHTSDLQTADWIVDFGADPSQLAVPVKVVLDLGGAWVLKVRR
jgi:hypothetical protein